MPIFFYKIYFYVCVVLYAIYNRYSGTPGYFLNYYNMGIDECVRYYYNSKNQFSFKLRNIRAILSNEITAARVVRNKIKKTRRTHDHRHDVCLVLFACLFTSNCRGVFMKPKMFYPQKSEHIQIYVDLYCFRKTAHFKQKKKKNTIVTLDIRHFYTAV